ncbi:MAG TPA: hypothetical protein VF242_09295 [Nitrososphaeraceae archaeon]
MKILNLLVVISLISFLSITLITASPFISYTNFFENNSHILLKFPSIYAQDDGGGEDNGDGGGDGGGVEDNDVGNEGINENTNDFSPLSFDSPTNPDDEVNQTDQQQQQQLEQQIVGIDVDQHADQTSQQQAFGADVEQK